jgi:hypothetical protein
MKGLIRGYVYRLSSVVRVEQQFPNVLHKLNQLGLLVDAPYLCYNGHANAQGSPDMTAETLYQECPFCLEAPVILTGGAYTCTNCGLTLREKSVLGLFKKGTYGIAQLPEGRYSLVKPELKQISLRPEPLQVVIGNIYTDQQLAEIATGSIDIVRPVRTIKAQIILEQLKEVCHLNVNGLQRGYGQPLNGHSSYLPSQRVPREGMQWQDEGNLFCTNQRIVFPSNQFTFIRLDRKMINVQAFFDGVAVQRSGEEFATYFEGCFPHEAALVAAYIMAKVPLVRPKPAEP